MDNIKIFCRLNKTKFIWSPYCAFEEGTKGYVELKNLTELVFNPCFYFIVNEGNKKGACFIVPKEDLKDFEIIPE